MAYVVGKKTGTWEIREAHTTESGPRNRTLATFTVLTQERIEHAQARSSMPLDEHTLRKAALRAGAPVALRDVSRASGELLAELAEGRQPRQILQRLLLDALAPGSQRTSESARAAARWINATQRQRGETLYDLLLLTDQLPPSRTVAQSRFPRLCSTPS